MRADPSLKFLFPPSPRSHCPHPRCERPPKDSQISSDSRRTTLSPSSTPRPPPHPVCEGSQSRRSTSHVVPPGNSPQTSESLRCLHSASGAFSQSSAAPRSPDKPCFLSSSTASDRDHRLAGHALASPATDSIHEPAAPCIKQWSTSRANSLATCSLHSFRALSYEGSSACCGGIETAERLHEEPISRSKPGHAHHARNLCVS